MDEDLPEGKATRHDSRLVTDVVVERRTHAATVVGVVLAGVLASIVVPGPYDFGSTMIGLILLAILFSYGEAPASLREAAGFSAAVGICLLLALGVFVDRLINISGWPTPDDEHERWTLDQATPWWTSGWEALLVWLAISVVTFCVCAAQIRRRARLPLENGRTSKKN